MTSSPIWSQRVQRIEPYIFAGLSTKIAELEKSAGRKVLNLGPGSPDVPPSPTYMAKLAELVQLPDAHQYPGYGISDELAVALSSWYQQRFAVRMDKSQLLPLLGAKDGVVHLAETLLDPGDEVLVPDPGYPAYATSVQLAGGVPVNYQLRPENKFKLEVSALDQLRTDRTKAIWLNFPSNPTGQVIDQEQLTQLVNWCLQHQIVLLSDNPYSEITFDGYEAPSVLSLPGALEIAVEIGSFSKTYSLAGYRMGWIAGNSDIITGLARLKSQLDSGMSMPLQKLGAYVLTHPDEVWQNQLLATYQHRREVMLSALRKLGLRGDLPQAGLYLWLQIPDDFENGDEYSQWLLENKLIYVTPGTAYGSQGERFVRASICVDPREIETYVK